MTMLHPDLFPETLLVTQRDGQVIVTSLKVAEHFQRRHKNVMQGIENALSDIADEEFSRLNFQPRNQVVRGREYPYYDLSEEAFALTVMGFSGKQAMQWKLDFLKALIAMREQLAAQQARQANALFFLRPAWKPISEHPDMRRGELISLTGHKSPGSITACRRRMRQVGLF
jgi:Rha family phage regulatory protein